MLAYHLQLIFMRTTRIQISVQCDKLHCINLMLHYTVPI